MDRLTISGNSYRVECNFNAVLAYMDLRGEKNLTFLNEDMGMRDWLQLMTCCINEGERLDGKKHDYSAEEIGAIPMVTLASVIPAFIEIFGKQNASQSEAKKKE